MPKKKQAVAEPELAPLSVMDEAMDRMQATILGPTVGDIIQVMGRPETFRAWIGIVHSVNGGELTCYQPNGSNPLQFRILSSAVEVVGKARLKWPGPLPEKSRDYNKLDKV